MRASRGRGGAIRLSLILAQFDPWLQDIISDMGLDASTMDEYDKLKALKLAAFVCLVRESPQEMSRVPRAAYRAAIIDVCETHGLQRRRWTKEQPMYQWLKNVAPEPELAHHSPMLETPDWREVDVVIKNKYPKNVCVIQGEVFGQGRPTVEVKNVALLMRQITLKKAFECLDFNRRLPVVPEKEAELAAAFQARGAQINLRRQVKHMGSPAQLPTTPDVEPCKVVQEPIREAPAVSNSKWRHSMTMISDSARLKSIDEAPQDNVVLRRQNRWSQRISKRISLRPKSMPEVPATLEDILTGGDDSDSERSAMPVGPKEATPVLNWLIACVAAIRLRKQNRAECDYVKELISNTAQLGADVRNSASALLVYAKQLHHPSNFFTAILPLMLEYLIWHNGNPTSF